MSGNAARLYDEDFVRWTEAQAAALREAAGLATNSPLDWENLAEEIDSLGRSLRHELRSRLMVIVEHLLKLEHSPAVDPRRGWMETIDRERVVIEDLLQESPSLRKAISARRSNRRNRERFAWPPAACRVMASLPGCRCQSIPRSKYSAIGSLGIPLTATLSPPAGRGSSAPV